jgi:outer membrane lipoprotein carrier protein
MRKISGRLFKGFLAFVFAYFACIALCIAEEMNAETLMAKMEQAEKNVQSVQFDFEQEIAFTLTNEKQKNLGEIKFKKPDTVLMKQKNPIEQVILAEGKKVQIYTPSYNQVIVDSWDKWTANSLIPSSLLTFGNDWQDLRTNYDFSYLGMDGNNHQLLFAPKQKDQAKGKAGWEVKLYVDSQTFIPVQVVLKSENFEATTITKNYQLNPKFDKNAFKLAMPKGVEVIKLP